MALKVTVDLTDQDVLDIASVRPDLNDAAKISAEIYSAYIKANFVKAATDKRASDVATKLAALPAPSKDLVTALEVQQAAAKAALVQAEYSKLP